MSKLTRTALFFLFFISGFCSLVYQVVWTRMAFASFGIITPVLSVVLSIFMLGLALGSWLGGRWVGLLSRKSGHSAAFFYGVAELTIGAGAFAVPKLFALSESVLLPTGQMDSFRYLSLSALALAFTIFPWCVCMGTTFPFMMGYVREREAGNTGSFSFLYLANVLGAMAGTFCTAVVLVETLGFNRTLWVAAGGNFIIASVSFGLAWSQQRAKEEVSTTVKKGDGEPAAIAAPGNRYTHWILFTTGFCAMAMEVVWSRAFTPTLKTQVYSFAMIIFAYLGATFLGSLLYRWDLRRNKVKPMALIISMLAVSAFLPTIVNDPRWLAQLFWSTHIHGTSALILLASIGPFCALLGYLTPRLIDDYAAGQPQRAGQAYAVNVLGCILGPLVGCYLLLPFVSERSALVLLAAPFIVFWWLWSGGESRFTRVGMGLALGLAMAASLFLNEDFEELLARQAASIAVRHDYVATVISVESRSPNHERKQASLLVNGIGMTVLTPITKFMVHLPLAFHATKPQSVLVICFGMGTTFRSALSWGIDTTAVELVPSVTKAFAFYHADAQRLLDDPHGHIIVDDGRRYLRRTKQKFDVIVVDPPPPVEAAGSSLLFSTEFYNLAQQHLEPGGIVQMWFPGGDPVIGQAVARSICEVFPYVRCFPPVEDSGVHLLASMEPIPREDSARLVARMPPSARLDLMEWSDTKSITDYLGKVIDREYPVRSLLDPEASIEITDDHPLNEYFLLRQLRQSGKK